MDTDDFWLLWKGFNDKLEYETELIRRQTAILYMPLAATVKNPPSFNRLWPSGKKERIDSRLERAKLRMKKHREEEALREWKEKNESTTKVRS